MFHNFYYTHDEAGNCIHSLPADDRVGAFLSTACDKLVAISPEEYWRTFGIYMCHGAPQTYIAWEGRSLWLICVDEVHVVEFSNGQLRAMSLQQSGDADA